MEKVFSLAKLLPSYAQIEHYVTDRPDAGYLLRKVIENVDNLLERRNQLNDAETENASVFVKAVTDKFWEVIHTGTFAAVQPKVRKAYAVACFFKIFYMLFESTSTETVDRAIQVLDEAIMLGCISSDLYPGAEALQKELGDYFDDYLAGYAGFELPILPVQLRQQFACDIPQLECPSIETFREKCFKTRRPAVLLNTFTHWPAVSKWRNLNYILKVAGNRVVPVEIGSSYTSEDWSQHLCKIRNFLKRQFSTEAGHRGQIEYLAQHNLFDQIPSLKKDIRVPDYCALGGQSDDIDIKAWLGPEGTVSPMHIDQKHNLLCQVFGMKKVILASPDDAPFLYKFDEDMFANTSRIDAENLDFEQFPLARRAKFYHLNLQESDCLYIPPRWFHYVRSLSKSFSVSFWWD